MRQNRPVIRVTPSACIGLALAVILLPLDWVTAWLSAVVIHEICHVIAVKVCRARIHSIRFALCGATIITDELSYGQQIVCALAGPSGGLLLLLVSKWVPQMTICGCVQSAYNLLPLVNLDGGRALQGLLSIYLDQRKAHNVSDWVDKETRVILGILGVYIAWKLSWGTLIVLSVVALIRRRKIKISCKQTA